MRLTMMSTTPQHQWLPGSLSKVKQAPFGARPREAQE
jgi:hypothetical protein